MITGRDVGPQTGHNDFTVRTGGSPVYFMIVTGSDETSLYACRDSHNYVMYDVGRKENLLDALLMDKLTIPASSVFFCHGYLQHAGGI